jgi:hypothetical protein
MNQVYDLMSRVHDIGAWVHDTFIKYRPSNSRSTTEIYHKRRGILNLIVVAGDRLDGCDLTKLNHYATLKQGSGGIEIERGGDPIGAALEAGAWPLRCTDFNSN